MKNKDKKKFKDTKVGGWLSKNAPKVLDAVGDALPDKGVLGVVKNLIDSEPDLSVEQRMEFERLLMEQERIAQENVTDRWEADMNSDERLPKLIRPYMLITLVSIYFLFATIDSIEVISFEVKTSYIELLEILMLTAFGAYFAGRSYEKTRRGR
jgi:hypothetical protein